LSKNYCFSIVSKDYSATVREDYSAVAGKYCSKKRELLGLCMKITALRKI
jgi:hypothetical protein